MSIRQSSIAEVAVAKGLIGGPFGSSLVGNDYEQAGVPVIRGTNLGHGKYIDGEFVFVSDEKVARDLARNIASAGDVVFTQRGTLGQVALVPRDGFHRYVISQSQMRLRVDTAFATPEYLYYACSSGLFQKQIADNAISTGVPHINLGILSRLKIPLPSVHEQRAIAEVLGALDDKIAANAKLATTVDDFLASKFALLLQRPYESAPLATIAHVNELAMKSTSTGQLRYIDIAAVGVGTHEVPSRMNWEDAPSRARRKIRWGDTLWSTVRPNRRSHSLNLSRDPELVGSTGLAVLTPSSVGFAYLYEVTKRPDFTSHIESVAEGSAYPAVRADRFGEALVPILNKDVRGKFESIAAPMREHVHSLGEETRTLAAIRDALLPQLMSGALRIKDAEKLTDGAA